MNYYYYYYYYYYYVLQTNFHGCYVNGEFNHVVYRDDAVLLAPSPGVTESHTDTCCHYFTSHTLVIKYKKCKCMAICPKSLKDLCIPKLFVNGSLLRNVENEMYLGFIMTSLDDEDDTISKETWALYARVNMLLSKFRRCTHDVIKNCKLVFCCNAVSRSQDKTAMCMFSVKEYP